MDIFYVTHVDGREIENSLIKTRTTNRGRGLAITAQLLENRIPARATTVYIVGRTEYAAPILALTNTVYQVKGSVEFIPEPDKRYVVRGELGETYSAVWIEEEASSLLMGNKVEIHGSSKLGTFEK
ncbi:hypothetical protein ED236_04865 [Pseudomethylobacillus aquaticus]|uniref:Uncharacterized protein n=1 Tax=Pseudomethylobacillus aquaticus TaxID=2676064 RepID=A0A3N0V2V7_9PROT|nr:hypothetical protein ED236_04865 [Pseudomethylobacillus aquaticus]